MAEGARRAGRWSHDGEPHPDHPAPRPAAAGIVPRRHLRPAAGQRLRARHRRPLVRGRLRRPRPPLRGRPGAHPGGRGGARLRRRDRPDRLRPALARHARPSRRHPRRARRAPRRRRADRPARAGRDPAVGGVFSIGQGDGWIAPFWLIPVAVVAWFVISRDRRRGITSRSGPRPSAPYAATPARHRHDHVHVGCRPPPPPPNRRRRPRRRRPPRRMPAPSPVRTAAPPGPTARPPASLRRHRPLRRPAHPARAAAPDRPPAPPRPRRRRPSAFVGLLSLGIVLVGMGLGAALDDPMGFPGSAATLGFLIALTGVSLVVLALGSGAAPPASAACSSSTSACCSWPRRPPRGSRCRTVSATAPGPLCPPPATTSFELGAGDATLDLAPARHRRRSATTPQGSAWTWAPATSPSSSPRGSTPASTPASASAASATPAAPSSAPPSPPARDRSTSTLIGDEPVQVVVDAELGLGQITIQEQ